MNRSALGLAWLSAALWMSACTAESTEIHSVGKTESALRTLTREEALADFDQLVNDVRRYYAPLELKEKRYEFSFDSKAREYRARLEEATTAPEQIGIFKQLVAELNDIHVGLSDNVPSDESTYHYLPLYVAPVADTFVVSYVELEAQDLLARGDELLRIDGVPAAELVERFSKFEGMPNPLTRKHIAAYGLTDRDAYQTPGLEDGAPVEVVLRNAHGHERSVTLHWTQAPNVLPPTDGSEAVSLHRPLRYAARAQRVIERDIHQIGDSEPFYMTPEVEGEFEIEDNVVPSGGALRSFGVDPSGLPEIELSAYKYEYRGRKILLLRVPTYYPPFELIGTYLAWVRALLAEQGPYVDGLILDQTHNGGGWGEYSVGLASLLTSKPIKGVGDEINADRSNVEGYLAWSEEVGLSNPEWGAGYYEQAHIIDVAYSANQNLSPALPYPPDAVTIQPDEAAWTKPLLVLADELSISAADVFPFIIKTSAVAPIFGERTAGGGGSVSDIDVLANSRVSVRLTITLGTSLDPSGESEHNYIEDVGAAPDIQYSHTLADFRAGYVGYVRAFSDALLEQIKR